MVHWTQKDLDDKLARKSIIEDVPETKSSVAHVQSVNNVCKINIKPLSVNRLFQGRRFRTKEYDAYELAIIPQLPTMYIPEPPLRINLEFGFSNASADLDNPAKGILDILQKAYNFNDSIVYELNIKKVIVPKKQEYILFQIEGLK